MEHETILQLLKMDIGIGSNRKDAYFLALIASAEGELRERGIDMEPGNEKDMILLSDYAAWSYRNRQSNTGLSKNLEERIRRRILRKRAQYGENA